MILSKELHDSLQKFWEVEDLPKQSFLTPEEKYCEDFFRKTHYRQADGRYVVNMPLNEKIQLLGRSKQFALKQFFSMERKMAKNPTFRSDYVNFMRTHEECGFMSLTHETKEDGYYIPHHGVYTVQFKQIPNCIQCFSAKFQLAFHSTNVKWLVQNDKMILQSF